MIANLIIIHITLNYQYNTNKQLMNQIMLMGVGLLCSLR
jgi:hypothetical protein